jgi:hypothetical protein
MRRKDYEERVLATLRREFIEDAPKLEGDAALTHKGNLVTVEEIGIDASEPRRRVYFLFREESRPECLFGFHWVAVEMEWDPDPSSEEITIDPSKGYWGPEVYASTLVATYFMEQVEALGHGLPPDCDSEGITWVTGYRDWGSVTD